jgi:hypothetical protein
MIGIRFAPNELSIPSTPSALTVDTAPPKSLQWLLASLVEISLSML